MTRQEAFELTVNEFIDNDLTISSVDEADSIHSKFIKLRTELAVHRQIIDIQPNYRGEQKYGWDITPGIFRPPLCVNNPTTGKELEQKAIREFERVIKEKIGRNSLRSIFDKQKHGKDWDLLFQAQHAGIKTTLTDWSMYISSALYFATEESDDPIIENSDGQVWCFLVPNNIILGHHDYPTRESFYDLNPFQMSQSFLINSAYYISEIENRIFEYRMYKQKGRFFMSANDICDVPINQRDDLKKNIFRIKIPAQYKKCIRTELAEQNVTRKSMYIDESPSRQSLITEVNKLVFAPF